MRSFAGWSFYQIHVLHSERFRLEDSYYWQAVISRQANCFGNKEAVCHSGDNHSEQTGLVPFEPKAALAPRGQSTLRADKLFWHQGSSLPSGRRPFGADRTGSLRAKSCFSTKGLVCPLRSNHSKQAGLVYLGQKTSFTIFGLLILCGNNHTKVAIKVIHVSYVYDLYYVNEVVYLASENSFISYALHFVFNSVLEFIV